MVDLTIAFVVLTILFPFWKEILDLWIRHGFIFAFGCFKGRVRTIL